MNKVNDGIDYYYNGNCVTSGYQWYEYHFCAGGDVYAHYNRTSIHGHADGTLYAIWNSYLTGAACKSLLSFHENLVREI